MIKWRIVPLARVVIVFMFGIFLADKNNFLTVWHGSVLFILTILFYLLVRFSTIVKLKNRGYVLSGSLLLMIFLLGFIRYKTQVVDASPNYFGKKWVQNCTLLGVVKEIPKVRTSAKTQIIIKEICIEDKCEKAEGTIMAYFSKDDNKAIKYLPGDKIKFQGRVREVKTAGNPKSFDFKSFLKYRHILHQVYIKEADHEFLESNQLNVIENVAYDLRGKLLSVFEKYIKDPSELGVVSALVLGYNNAVPDELYQAFSNSGAVHVLAVSGMHVGIVASFFLFFLNLFKSKSNYWKIFKFIILLFVVWMFTFVTGAAPAVMRSAVMFTLIWIGKYWFENQNLFNILSASAFGMLFVDPYLLFHASFQFSYSAMWSLMFFQPHISRMLAFRSKFGNYLWNLISSSISAQVLVFPITIYFFHKFPLYFILSGVVAVITGVLALYLGLIVLVVEFVFQPLNIIIAKIFQLSSSLFIASVRWVKDLPGSSIDGLWMSETEFLLIYLTIFTIMLYMIIKSKKLIFLTGIFILTYIISFTEKKINSKNFIGFTVYDSFNTTLIDFFDGKDLYTYSSEVLTDDDMRFVCYNNRYYRGTSNNFSIKIPNNFEGLRIKQEGNIIRLKNQVVYIAKGEVDTNLVKISHFIVGLEETKWSIKGQNENLYNNKTIILDKSSKLGSVYKVRKLCKLPACKIHEINIEGSYNLEAI